MILNFFKIRIDIWKNVQFVHVCVVIDYANSMSALSMTKQKRVCLFVACEDKSEKYFLAGNLKLLENVTNNFIGILLKNYIVD